MVVSKVTGERLLNRRHTVRQCDVSAGVLAFAALGIALAPGPLPFGGRGPIFLGALSVLGMIMNGRRATRNKEIIRVVRIAKGQVALSTATLFVGAVVCAVTMVAISDFWGPFGLFLMLAGLVFQLLVKWESPNRSPTQNED